MNAQHTPGPWRVEVWDYPCATPPRQELNVQTADRLLATLQCDFSEENPFIIPHAEANANARLIAAAPELLEALNKAVAYLEANRPAGKIREIFSKLNELENGVIKPARAAIAKATSVPSVPSVPSVFPVA